MERTRRYVKIAVVLLIFVLSCAAAALVYAHRNRETEQNTQIARVTVILPHKGIEYWNLIQEGIEEAEEELSETCSMDIKILVPQLNYNIGQITELLKQQIAAKVDYIVVQGSEDEDFLAVLLKAWEEGIQIICVDTDIPDFPDHLYIGTDNYAAGRMLGEKLVELTDGHADVLVMSGEETYLNLRQRLQGLSDVIDEQPGIEIREIVCNHFDGLTATKIYREYAGAADALVCLEGSGSVAVSALSDSDGKEYPYILGFDAFEEAKNGALDGIIRQDTSRIGHQIAEEIARHIETGSYSADCIYTDIVWVTADNHDEA